MKLSVSIITFNEEKNIERCIRSVTDIADEIVVVDSLSTDNTKLICLDLGTTFIEQPFLGYKEQKNFALNQVQHEHVLSLDADEALSPELLESIKREKAAGFPAAGYTMNRRSWYCDNWIYHGYWYPDTKLRLAKKSKVHWNGINPHDKLEIEPQEKVAHLEGDILHYTYYTIDEHIQQGNKFSTIAAKAYFEQGKRSSVWKMLINPSWAFFSSYILKKGFLDGFNGFVISKQTAHQTFLKYAKLLQLQRMAKASHKTSN
ncbi:MAG TPA: glycosyltransferase family 2 protein [Chitinophagaceae bacterium]|nr:glycosyltransferase family 2 protein [Chitinophagaceae bacterium]